MPAGAQTTVERHRPIIDMHLHALPVKFLPELEPPGLTRPESEEELLRATLAALEQHNIVKAVTSGPQALVQQWKAAAPNRVIASPMFPHFAPYPVWEQLRADYTAGRFGAMGEINAQYAGLPLNALELEPYFALAEELDVPVGVHTGVGPPGVAYGCCPKFRVAAGNPLPLEEVLVQHPRLRVYLMHAGGPFLQETIALMHLHPQLYADLAVIDWAWDRNRFHEHLHRLIEAGFGRRLMFGSDQMVWPEAIGMAIEGIESADFLSEDQKRDIFCRNAARFLRLDPQLCE